MGSATTGGRRLLVVAALAAALLLTAAWPAGARFGDAQGVQTAVTTATVPPPTDVTAVEDRCHPVHWARFDVSWTASTSARITGYLVRAHLSNGRTALLAWVGPWATSASVVLDRVAVDRLAPTLSVTALTGTAWTGVSARSAVVTC